ncbi:beta-galactosidase 1-like [Typha angustifolia]|uniref:beta-galactosidase 1-like n=1 Tax=Typha angustifolia TaxID=59011 RepID=UPI003C2ED465
MKLSRGSLLVSLLVLISLCNAAQSTDVTHDGRSIIINGQHRILISGSIHYPRSTPQMWPDLIQKAKEGGLDAIETYVFWNGHEPRRREYNFEGRYDIIRFIKEIQNAGLYAVLRIGPYACAEWNYGGIPAWLRKIPGMQFRTNNQPFKDEMETFTRLIVDMVKKERLLAPQGGPIIITQIENEYGNIMWEYKDAGKEYIKWCAKMAESLAVGIPWVMCQQSDAPQPMINTCNGFYCDNFTPNNATSPKMWTENWTGWFKAWDKPDPHRLPEDLAYSVARFFQSNGTFMNYYMYHGGTNFGRTSGGPYIVTSYDYDAPLDEYGNLRQPKWGHLKELHAVLKSMENVLTNGDYTNIDRGNGVEITKFSVGENAGCFISNKDAGRDASVDLDGAKYFVPAWSISILPDCKNEAYNTAKVDTQTSLMVKKQYQAEDGPPALQWSWLPERLKRLVKGTEFSFQSNNLLEQITTTADESDYLWYITSFNHAQRERMTLQVNTTGHVLYAFVNKRLVGQQYAPNGNFQFLFQSNVSVKHGKNYLALLSATVGLKNYGAKYELAPAGIVGGPVKLSAGSVTIDLSNSTWSYKTGLDGEEEKIYLNDPALKWRTRSTPINQPFTWYKTTFQAPLGSEPVVIDLLGMGKGEAWINGNSIGRFWPTSMASNSGCNKCDYRGQFKENSCQTGCGEPAQRWYHIPRSFLKDGESNTLVLFEEAGGNPSRVNFQVVTVGTVCATVDEGKTMTLSCAAGYSISKIDFASFGDTKGTCGDFERGTCESSQAFSVVSQACVGKHSCSIQVDNNLLGETNCGNSTTKIKLSVQAAC